MPPPKNRTGLNVATLLYTSRLLFDRSIYLERIHSNTDEEQRYSEEVPHVVEMSTQFHMVTLFKRCINEGSTVFCRNCKYISSVRFPGKNKNQQHSRRKF